MAPNRDESTEDAPLAVDSPEAEVAEVAEQSTGGFFPTSMDLARARRAAGMVRPNQPGSIDALLEVADALRAERDLA